MLVFTLLLKNLNLLVRRKKIFQLGIVGLRVRNGRASYTKVFFPPIINLNSQSRTICMWFKKIKKYERTENEKYTYSDPYPTGGGGKYVIFMELPRGNHFKSFLALFHLITAAV